MNVFFVALLKISSCQLYIIMHPYLFEFLTHTSGEKLSLFSME